MYYDLETCIVSKGQGRAKTIPIEIAMLDADAGEYTQCAFWPLSFPVRDALRDHGANVAMSLKCVKKVFGCVPTEHGPGCATLRGARSMAAEFMEARESSVLVAHNGRSFDHPIYKEWFEPSSAQRYGDSLRTLRAARPALLSHSLPVLTRSVRERVVSYMLAHDMDSVAAKQHRALFDCVALAEVMKHFVPNVCTAEGAPPAPMALTALASAPPAPTESGAESWESVAGVGKKTAAAARVKFSGPSAFVSWARKRSDDDVRAVLRVLGVRRAPTLLRYARAMAP